MRRHLRCGRLLLDERAGRDPGRSGSWVESAPRRSAGRVLAGQDDAQYIPPRDVTTYVLDLLKTGASAAGFAVVGVDVSQAMLELARSNAATARFVATSLWELAFPRPLAAVTAFGEALNYGAPTLPSLSELAALFGRVSRCLMTWGLFAFDVVVSGESLAYRSRTDGDGYTVLVDVSEDPRASTMTRSIVTFTRGSAGYRRCDETHVLRVYDFGEIQQALSDAGFAFSTSDSYGAYPLSPRRAAFVAWLPGGGPCLTKRP